MLELLLVEFIIFVELVELLGRGSEGYGDCTNATEKSIKIDRVMYNFLKVSIFEWKTIKYFNRFI